MIGLCHASTRGIPCQSKMVKFTRLSLTLMTFCVLVHDHESMLSVHVNIILNRPC